MDVKADKNMALSGFFLFETSAQHANANSPYRICFIYIASV